MGLRNVGAHRADRYLAQAPARCARDGPRHSWERSALLWRDELWRLGWGSPLSEELAGLATCYVAGLPFYRNQVVGDLVYAGALFGLYWFGMAIHARYRVHPTG